MLLKFGRGAVFCAGYVGVLSFVLQEARVAPGHPTDPASSTIVMTGIPLTVCSAMNCEFSIRYIWQNVQWILNNVCRNTEPSVCVCNKDMMKVISNRLIVSRLGLANTRRSFGATASCLCQKQALHHSMNLLWAPKPLSKISSLKVTTLSHIKKFSSNPCKLILLPRK